MQKPCSNLLKTRWNTTLVIPFSWNFFIIRDICIFLEEAYEIRSSNLFTENEEQMPLAKKTNLLVDIIYDTKKHRVPSPALL